MNEWAIYNPKANVFFMPYDRASKQLDDLGKSIYWYTHTRNLLFMIARFAREVLYMVYQELSKKSQKFTNGKKIGKFIDIIV